MTSHTEIEIKLEVSAAARAGVLAALVAQGGENLQRTRLQAVYVDTADRRLARHHIALRVRQEGDRWVQTLKAAGVHGMARLEHNVDLGNPRHEPAIDAQRHAGTPAGDRLFAVLDQAPLAERYRTDIERLHCEVAVDEARIELALDVGDIQAGDARWPVSELELELLQGTPEDLVAEAGRWAERHGLWVDVRSKAERGERLASGQRTVPARQAGAFAWPSQATRGTVLRAAVAQALQPVLANAAEVADGLYDDEQVHQLRVGLRRLRTALRYFGDRQDAPLQAWHAALGELARRLGVARDHAALRDAFETPLRAVGAPLVTLPMPPAERPETVLREPSITRLWLALQAFAMQPEAAPSAPAEEATLRRLRRWHREVIEVGREVAHLDDAARHALRKRVKRLRDAASFAADLFQAPPHAKRLRRYLRELARVQSVLGDSQDAATALLRYRDHAMQDPRAWFAVGWLTARQDTLRHDAADALRGLCHTRTPWSGQHRRSKT